MADEVPTGKAGVPVGRRALNSDVVKRIADLAQIQLSPEEEERAWSELGAIVGYVEQLNELDTSGVEPLHHVLDLRNVMREDEPRASLPLDIALMNAPARKGDYFLVPKVIEGKG